MDFFQILSTARIIIVKHPIQGRNNVTRVRIEPRSCDQRRRKNDAFTLSATLLTMSVTEETISQEISI